MHSIAVFIYLVTVALVVLVPAGLMLRWVVLPAPKDPRFSLRATLFDIIGVASLPVSWIFVRLALAPDDGGGSGLAWMAIMTVSSWGVFGLAVVVTLCFSVRLALRVPRWVWRHG